jgi:MFS family permease
VPSAATPLRYREFRRLWLASVASNLGSFLQTVASTWLMLQLTGSAFWVGLMVAAPTLPLLLVAMPAGAMADLFERRRIVLVSQLVLAATAGTLALLGFLGLITAPILLGLGIALGTATAFNLPAQQAMTPDLVPNHHVAGAVALNSVALNVARAVGPALGGLIVATAGPQTAFALNAVTYLAVVVAVSRLPRASLDDHEPIGTAIASGLRYARYTPSYRWLLLVAASFALTSAVVQATLPTFTAERFGRGAEASRLPLSAMGVGALIGAFSRPAVADRLRSAMVPAGIAAFGLAGVGLGLSPSLPVAMAALVVAGVLWVYILVTLNATAQLMSPSWVRGRIMSLYQLSFLGVLPIGSILAGALADAIGSGRALVALSSATVVLGALVRRLPLPVLADVVAPQPAAPATAPTHPDEPVGEGTVLVVNTWHVAAADRAAFLAAMEELRRVRLRTGAFRWRLYRAVDDPDRITELFVLPSWSEHLRQHARLDLDAVAAIQRARSFDTGDGPLNRHLVAIDVTDESAHLDWEAQVALHDAMHRSDGSLPLRDDVEAAAEEGRAGG